MRARRLIWAGPAPGWKRTTSSSGTGPNLLDGTVNIFSVAGDGSGIQLERELDGVLKLLVDGLGAQKTHKNAT